MLPEQRKVKLSLLVINPLDKIFKHYSDWRRLISSVAWIQRFIKYLKVKGKLKCSYYLTVPELKTADMAVLKQLQKEVFAGEILELEKGNYVSKSSKLKGLSPYLEKGLILVGERLRHAILP